MHNSTNRLAVSSERFLQCRRDVEKERKLAAVRVCSGRGQYIRIGRTRPSDRVWLLHVVDSGTAKSSLSLSAGVLYWSQRIRAAFRKQTIR